MAGEQRRDAETEGAASQHSGWVGLPQQQDRTHTGRLCLPQMLPAPNNHECDSQLRERPNAGRRARKLQTTWDKAPTGQLQPIPAELLSQTKIKAVC